MHAAGASASTAPIDLTSASQAESPFEVEVRVGAVPNLATGKSATVTLEDSTNESAFAAIAELAPVEIAGGVGGGAAASLRVRLPAAARRRLRATAEMEADGGDNTATSLSLALIF